MARGTARFSGSNQFWIQEPELLPDPATWDQSNGLAVTAEHGAVILTSEFVGSIQVTVEALDERPPVADEPDGLAEGQAWDDVVEISVSCGAGPLSVLPLDDEVDLPRLDSTGPSDYRLRVHARSRDVPAFDDDGFETSTDEYLIVSWPEPRRPPLLIRLTDRRGFSTRVSLL